MSTLVLLPLQGANIGRHATPAATRASIVAVRQGPINAGVPIVGGGLRPAVGWQEVNDDNAPVNERGMIADLFQPDRFTTWPRTDGHPGCLVPVTLPEPWGPETPADQWAEKIGEGRPAVQPDRYITIRVARHPLLSAPLAVASWQMIQGAFTDPGQPHEAWRDDEWATQWHAIQDAVAPVIRQGITVAYVADTNRPRCPVLRWDDHRVTQQGLDALGWIPGRGKHALTVRVRKTWTVPLRIDGHNGTGALLALS